MHHCSSEHALFFILRMQDCCSQPYCMTCAELIAFFPHCIVCAFLCHLVILWHLSAFHLEPSDSLTPRSCYAIQCFLCYSPISTSASSIQCSRLQNRSSSQAKSCTTSIEGCEGECCQLRPAEPFYHLHLANAVSCRPTFDMCLA